MKFLNEDGSIKQFPKSLEEREDFAHENNDYEYQQGRKTHAEWVEEAKDIARDFREESNDW